MKKTDVLKHFDGVINTANALGISKQAVSKWPDEIPRLRAYQIERITKGQLKADDHDRSDDVATKEAGSLPGFIPPESRFESGKPFPVVVRESTENLS